MKTKEIDVWVIKNRNKPLEKDHLLCCFSEEERDNWLEKCDEVYKATLTIQVPEKKIEITESDLDRAYQVYFNDEESFRSSHFLKVIKKELGF